MLIQMQYVVCVSDWLDVCLYPSGFLANDFLSSLFIRLLSATDYLGYIPSSTVFFVFVSRWKSASVQIIASAGRYFHIFSFDFFQGRHLAEKKIAEHFRFFTAGLVHSSSYSFERQYI